MIKNVMNKELFSIKIINTIYYARFQVNNLGTITGKYDIFVDNKIMFVDLSQNK